MGTLAVSIKEHPYEVRIERNAYRHFPTTYRSLFDKADKIGIIVDETVKELHLQTLLNELAPLNRSIVVHTVPAGEPCKSSTVYLDCLSFFLQQGFTRNSLLLAVGGGAVGDLTGFVAASFMRGIAYIQCPTTILAHDSAVGGKTAINMPEGKNLVGAFHQPVAVVFDTNLFETLPAREFRSGMAELLKHAYISDEQWTMELMKGTDFSAPSIDWLESELLRGTAVKAQVVEEDEFEHGSRKFLNLGHTFGHAIEAASGYGRLSHGECVMIGMTYSLLMSEQVGSITSEQTNDLIRFAQKNGYDFSVLTEHSFESLLTYMKKDKKASFGEIHFVVLAEIGRPMIRTVTEEMCRETYKQLVQRVGELA